MRIKSGVLLESLSPQMVLAALIVDRAYSDHAHECTITSGSDGKHKAGSLHYVGDALDFRTRDVEEAVMTELVATIKERLGENYDVVVEADHLHCEYDPK